MSPGEQVAIMAAWIPHVVPPTRNHVSNDPKSLAACCCASKMGPSGEKRLSSSGSSGKSWIKGLAPISCVKADGAARPLL